MKIYNPLSARLFKISSNEAAFSTWPFNTDEITDTIQRAFTSAGLDTQSELMKSVTDTIQQALSAAGLTQCSAAASPHGIITEDVASEVFALDINTDFSRTELTPPAKQTHPSEFISRSFTNHAGTRTYKLYIPSSYSKQSAERVPLVVMLHGCTQSPDDFAAGTRMNELSEQYGFLVAYPAQTANANGSKCWNWFRTEDQERDCGEPSLIAGITREVASRYRVDERRIFVAGLSAGAAMAVVLGATYPDLYTAVGAHSGLPYGAAHDMPSAFSAMKGGSAPSHMLNMLAARAQRRQEFHHTVPTIVFHGDCDHTVDVRNGIEIVKQATMVSTGETRLRAIVDQGAASNGRKFSRTVYVDGANQLVVEQWVLHGAGHAWSGGSPEGSFTDACGPDASAEMIRFFYSQQRAGTA